MPNLWMPQGLNICTAELALVLPWKPLTKELDNLPENSYLELDVRKTRYLDNDIIEILDDFSYKAKIRNITIKLISERGTVVNPPSYLEFFRLTPKKELYKTLGDVSR